MSIRYISIFSGIGGLESSKILPALLCESDLASRKVLARTFPGVQTHDDVHTMHPEPADFVVGGWPCQDLSTAGLMTGLEGFQSKLFYEFCRVVKESRAHTAIMENVPGLKISNRGRDFKNVLLTLRDIGLTHISWRTLNTAEFGIPQYRERIFIVASRFKENVLALQGSAPPESPSTDPIAAPYPQVIGFYWTASARSLCLRKNAVPALKVGAPSVKGGTSPVAVFYGNIVRKLTVKEAWNLQGFNAEVLDGIKYGDALRMAGDAVSRPVGSFVVDSVFESCKFADKLWPTNISRIPDHGYWHEEKCWAILHDRTMKPRHLWQFLDNSDSSELSHQASAGLCCRIIRAGVDVPAALFEVLYEKSKKRTKLVGTKIDSFEILHSTMDPLSYLQTLKRNQQRAQLELFDQ